jgi:hypothetical protein
MPATIELEPDLNRLMRRHCRRLQLLSAAEIGLGDARELVYQVKFFRSRDREALLVALRQNFEAHDARLMLQDATSEY